MTKLSELSKLCDAAVAIVDEENRRLGAGSPAVAFPEVIESKTRLSLQLAAAVEAARHVLAQPSDAEDPERDALGERFACLKAVVAENNRLLKARIGVTQDLIATVLATARAQSSATTRGYVRDGRAVESHRPAAIAIDRAV